jgi:hypothetical protein
MKSHLVLISLLLRKSLTAGYLYDDCSQAGYLKINPADPYLLAFFSVTSKKTIGIYLITDS